MDFAKIKRIKQYLPDPRTAVRGLVFALFLYSSVTVMTAEEKYTDASFAASLGTASSVLFLLAFAAVYTAVFSFVRNIRIEKTVLLVSSLIFSCSLLYAMNDAYLYAAVCAVQAAVCFYCMSGGKAALLPKGNKKLALIGAAALGLFFSVWIGGLTALRYKMYISPCFDFGIFAQMFENMRRVGAPLSTCERDMMLSHFAVHLSFIYYLLLPFYYIFHDPAFLNVAQAVVLASGVVPMYLICRGKKLSPNVTLAMCAVYIFYPALSAGCFYDIHENCFLTPLLLWLMYAVDRDATAGIFLSAALVCAVKEDAPVYVIFVCIYMFFAKKKLLKPAILLAVCVTYFLLAIKYLDTYGDGAMMYRYSNFFSGDGTMRDIVKTVLTNPGYVFLQCLNEEKAGFFLSVLLPLGFLPLVSKKFYNYILLGPFMLINLMSYYPYQHSLDFQYNFGPAALLLYLTAENLSQLRPRKRPLYALLCAFLSLLGALCFVGQRTSYIDYYKKTADTVAGIEEVVEQVPEGVSVSAATFILPHLAEHEILYQVNGRLHETEGRTEYVILDLRYSEFADLKPLYLEAGYELVYEVPGAASLLRCPFYAGE